MPTATVFAGGEEVVLHDFLTYHREFMTGIADGGFDFHRNFGCPDTYRDENNVLHWYLEARGYNLFENIKRVFGEDYYNTPVGYGGFPPFDSNYRAVTTSLNATTELHVRGFSFPRDEEIPEQKPYIKITPKKVEHKPTETGVLPQVLALSILGIKLHGKKKE
jgi:hypothetical protein